MFDSTIRYFPALATAMTVNLALGVYLNIGVKKIRFCWKKFGDGVLKAIILAFAFLGLAYCFDATSLKDLGLSPDTIMTAAITLYVTKGCIKLANILGVQVGGTADSGSSQDPSTVQAKTLLSPEENDTSSSTITPSA